MIATMMCSLGVPFLTAGDERGRTQRGNNNAYCQDNEISWLDWSRCDTDMLDFTRRMTAFRRQHGQFRRRDYFDGKANPVSGLRDVAWLEGDGTLLCHEEWHNDSRRCFGALLDAVENSPPLVLIFNNGTSPLPFLLPGDEDTRWTLVFDTGFQPAFPHSSPPHYAGQKHYQVKDRSLVCLKLTAGRCDLIEPKAC